MESAENRKQIVLDTSDTLNNEDSRDKIINKNGFTGPLTCFQKAPLVYVVFMASQLAVIAITMQEWKIKVILMVFWVLVFGATASLWVITSKIDPTDTIQILHKKHIEEDKFFNTQEYKYFCYICATCVSSNSFHCRRCNRCVEVFDHHCKWLNNCIGAKNYFQFLGLISCSWLLLSLHMILNIVDCFDSMSQGYILFSFEIVFLFSDFILFCLNTSLLAVHIYLAITKKTTIELIKEKRINQKIYPILNKKSS